MRGELTIGTEARRHAVELITGGWRSQALYTAIKLKLPDLIKGRRANGALVQQKLADHPRFMIQQEIGQSSWFGFSLVLRDAAPRADFVRDLVCATFPALSDDSGDIWAKCQSLSF